MKRNFVQITRFLEEQFPELRGNVTGEIYPLPPIIELLSNILSFIQLIGMAWMILGGEKILNMIGYGNSRNSNNQQQRPYPAFYYTINENPVPIMIFLFLLAPQLLGTFQANGAFEIYLNNHRIYSKLISGKLPTVDELVTPLIQHGLKRIELK